MGLGHGWAIGSRTLFPQVLGVKPVDPVYWTLFAGLRFYPLFAIVAWGGLTYRRVLLFCCLWGSAALASNRFGFGSFGQFLTPEHCWYLLAGMAFYLMYRFRKTHRVGPTVLLGGLIGAMTLAAYLVHRIVEEPLGRRLKPRVRAGVKDAAGRAERSGVRGTPGVPRARAERVPLASAIVPGVAVPGRRREPAVVGAAAGHPGDGTLCPVGRGHHTVH